MNPFRGSTVTGDPTATLMKGLRPLLVGLIGAGIQGSLTPSMQEEEARHHGLRLHYQLIDLDRTDSGAEALPISTDGARVSRAK